MPTLASTAASVRVVLEDQSVSPSRLRAYLVRPGQPLRFGREADSNDIVAVHSAVSRKHLEFYVVMFDEGYDCPPMVYVRDMQSTNGTFVNGHLIGQGPCTTPGRLLDSDDLVTIEPHWAFTIDQDTTAFTKDIAPPWQLADAQLIRRFKMTGRSLGSGAYATVFLAEDRQTNQQLICKVHQLSKLSDDCILRAKREAAVLSQLDHPNILAFRQAFRSKTTLFLFAELATGGDLYSLLATRGCFSEIETKLIVRQVVLAVNYIHTKGIAHRDLKLENILCSAYPSCIDRIVLCDFGHAATRNQGRLQSHVGTVRHQAPELVLGGCEHDFSVDLWAIGVITLKLLTAADCSIADMEAAPGTEQWLATKLDLGCKSPQLSQSGRHFISRCLALEPKNRITAAEAVQHEWFSTPDNHRLLLLKLEEDSRANWTPREVLLPVVQELSMTAVRIDEEEDVAEDQVTSGYFAHQAEQTQQTTPRKLKRLIEATCEVVSCKLIKCEST